MDYIMWLILGIFIYLAIGYAFVWLIYVHEEGIWEQIKVMLFWPTICITLVACCIVFTFIGIRNRIKKKNHESKIY